VADREVMDVDVIFVGGGIASLSGALHLSNLIARHNEQVEKTGEGRALGELMIAVLEKGAYIGAHAISGAVMNPVALKELIPDFLEKGAPLEGEVKREEVLFLTETGRFKFPITPPPLRNHGHYVVSLSRLTEWIGKMLEERGVYMFPGFAGSEVLYEGDRVIGVRTGDKGIDADGSKRANYEPGIDLRAKVTVFGEGSRGSLTKSLVRKFNLDQGKNPQSYVVGVKEVWEVDAGRLQPGDVVHSMGYPLKANTYGGGFIYGMKDNKVSVGLLVGLDYKDPFMDPHGEFQKFKLHPYVAELLKDGKLIQYGAKTAPVGGFFAVPKLVIPGGMLVGDSASLFISMKLKGIHAAMKSGMVAAETIFEALLKQDFSEEQLSKYRTALSQSYIGSELLNSRNFHQGFEKGLYAGLMLGGLYWLLGGRILKARVDTTPDFTHLKSVKAVYGVESPSEEEKGNIKYDGKRTFDKETDV
jgi:electron-transferring-flavoprotein dehydrogenase